MYKELEIKILSKIVKDFICRKKYFLERMKDGSEGSKEIMEEVLFSDWINLNNTSQKFLYKSSTFFIPFVKKMVGLLQYPMANKMCGIMQYIFNEVIINISRIEDYNLRDYFKNTLKFLAVKCLEFNDFLKEREEINNNYFLKEYFIACFVPFMLLPLGKIENMVLYEKVMKIWIIFDNIADGIYVDKKYRERILKESAPFFKLKLYLVKEEREKFYRGCDKNPIIECFEEIDRKCQNEEIRRNVFGKLRKLYKFSYSKKNKEELVKNGEASEKKLLKYTCLKNRKSIDIIICCLELGEKERSYLNREVWNEEYMEKYYNVSLMIQLLDDVLDIRKDMLEGGRSIFTQGTKNEKLAGCLVLNNLFEKYGEVSRYYFQLFLVFFMSYNSKFFEDDVGKLIEERIGFVNLKVYNMEIIFNLMEDRDFMVKSFLAYTNNVELEKERDENEIIEELEKI